MAGQVRFADRAPMSNGVLKGAADAGKDRLTGRDAVGVPGSALSDAGV